MYGYLQENKCQYATSMLKVSSLFYNSVLSIDYSASEYKTRNELKVILLPFFSLIIYVMQINFIIKKTTRQLMSV